MSSSLLVRRRVPADGELRFGSVIALHGGDGNLDDLVPLARSLSPGLDVIAPQAPRRVHYVPSTAYTWFYAQEPQHPEPVTFGDSLYQLEQLVYEVAEVGQEEAKPLYLLGYDQGALLALSLALVVPDYLSGVVAICGCLPELAVWPLPDRSLDGLGALVVSDPEDAGLPAHLVSQSANELSRRGGVPTMVAVSGARELGPVVSKVVGDWMREQIGRFQGESRPTVG
jgi:phospholipase/carboxylesterase